MRIAFPKNTMEMGICTKAPVFCVFTSSHVTPPVERRLLLVSFLRSAQRSPQ